jgi:hypothetical protein
MCPARAPVNLPNPIRPAVGVPAGVPQQASLIWQAWTYQSGGGPSRAGALVVTAAITATTAATTNPRPTPRSLRSSVVPASPPPPPWVAHRNAVRSTRQAPNCGGLDRSLPHRFR